MTGIREPLGAGEKVLTVVRKEGASMKPEDARCRAVDEETSDGRCEGDISLDTKTGTWLVFCISHRDQEKDARVNGGPRVERVGADTAE